MISRTSPQPSPANYQEDQPDNIVGYNSIRVPWHLGTDALHRVYEADESFRSLNFMVHTKLYFSHLVLQLLVSRSVPLPLGCHHNRIEASICRGGHMLHARRERAAGDTAE